MRQNQSLVNEKVGCAPEPPTTSTQMVSSLDSPRQTGVHVLVYLFTALPHLAYDSLTALKCINYLYIVFCIYQSAFYLRLKSCDTI